MGDKNMLSNKIGARCLTGQEAELILPTYKQIFVQLETFRSEKNTVNENDQKTNNIGIIGVRGAGKTSILKSIRAELEARNPQDIMLPIIVPENMSESGTLMATILGMLGDIVHRHARDEKRKDKKANGTCCIGESELERRCHNTLKQYTYIQREYRDILIQQYTSENDYVKSSAKLFNSDTEFISQFNALIDELVRTKRDDKNLLVLFIDDIDLSTWRCMDVVKTLLSYLANKNIVTFISGDLETFEEALTVEFLRQEKVLKGDIMEKTFLAKGANEKNFLESKKQLAYEYLKKILPPVYRHYIKEWSLEERGKYCIHSSEEKQGMLDLSELLNKALKDWVDPAFFQYTESNGIKGVLPYTYHLFDSTSRGLNNVYNVLIGIVESRTTDKAESDGEIYLKEKRQLLDTVIASKKIYNQYRNELWTRIITVGTTSASSKVYLDNAYSIIYGEGATEKGESYKIAEPVERFSLFVLVDFAARLLYEQKYAEIIEMDENYQKMKREAMWDLFCHPAIAEKVLDVERNSFLGEEDVSQEVQTLREVNHSFLEKGDIVFNLAYYKNLPLDRLLSLGREDNSNYSSAKLQQEVLSAFWKAISSTAEVNGIKAAQKLGEYYYTFREELTPLLNTVSTSAEQNIAIRLFDKECHAIIGEIPGAGELFYRQRIMQNTIAKLLKTEIGNGDDGDWKKVNLERTWTVVNGKFCEENDKEKLQRQIAVLKAFHEGRLWREEMAEAPIAYLRNALGQWLTCIDKALVGGNRETGNEWILDTSRAEDHWREFRRAYDGVSETKASLTKEYISSRLEKEGNPGASFDKGMTFHACMEIRQHLKELSGNNRVWYGQYDAWKVERDLWEAWARPDEDWESSERYSYFKFLLQCCYRYKKTVEFEGESMEYAKILQKIAEGISEAHGYAYGKIQSTFMEKLNAKLKENKEEPVDDEEFNKLFPLK